MSEKAGLRPTKIVVSKHPPRHHPYYTVGRYMPLESLETSVTEFEHFGKGICLWVLGDIVVRLA